jgi:hypothetical protein
LLEELSILLDNPVRGENEPPISEYYKELTPLSHLIQSWICPLAFNHTYESLFYESRVSFDEGKHVTGAEDHNEELKKVHEKMRNSKCFATGGSKMENKPFVGFAAIDISDDISCKFRIAKIASTFTAEALAIGDRLDIIENIDSEQTFVIFLDSESVLKGISNTSTMATHRTLLKCLKTK